MMYLSLRSQMIKQRRPYQYRRRLNQTNGLFKVILILVLVIHAWNVIDDKEMFTTTNAMDVKWTPNPNDDNPDNVGPLPLSNNQRQQLLQLEQTIMNSPNPQATLEQIASSNSMSSKELYNLLQRNHNDMEQVGNSKTGSQQQQRRTSTMITTVIWNTMTTLFGVVWQVIHHNPKLTTFIGLSILLTIYVSTIIIPQNGMMINQDRPRNILTKGPTSIFYPPTSYIQQLILDNDHDYEDEDNHYNNHKLFHMTQSNSKTNTDDLWKYVDFSVMETNEQDDYDHNTVITKVWKPKHNTKRNNNHTNDNNKIQLVISSQKNIDITDIQKNLLKSKKQSPPKTKPTKQQSSSSDIDDDNYDDNQIHEKIIDWCLFHAASICYTTPHDILNESLYVNDDKKSFMKLITPTASTNENNNNNEQHITPTKGMLIVPGMGDFGRYAIIPIFITTNKNTVDDEDEDDNNNNLNDNDTKKNEDDNNDDLYLTLTIAPGAHFDGQIHITIQPSHDATTTITSNLDNEQQLILPNQILVRASIIVPNHGKIPNTKIAKEITNRIVQSIVSLIQIRTQQSIVRTQQSNQYQLLASKRANQKRTHRTTLERQMEEMAIDRRRKWQHQNPSGVSNYRPSHDRLHNPNNSILYK